MKPKNLEEFSKLLERAFDDYNAEPFPVGKLTEYVARRLVEICHDILATNKENQCPKCNAAWDYASDECSMKCGYNPKDLIQDIKESHPLRVSPTQIDIISQRLSVLEKWADVIGHELANICRNIRKLEDTQGKKP